MNNQSINGVNIAYHTSGSGTPVLMAHCSSDSHRQWSFVDALLPGYQLIAPDLIGYGGSDAWPTRGDMPFNADAQVIDALIQQNTEAVHLIGHSYGGAMCLETIVLQLQANRLKVKSLLLIEPIYFHLLKNSRYADQWLAIQAVGDNCTACIEAGDLSAAADIFMGFWIGDAQWQQMPDKHKQVIIPTMAKVGDELRGLDRFTSTMSTFDALDIPVTVIRGERSPQPARAVAELLAEQITQAELVEIPGAGHMIPQSHPAAIGEVIVGFKERHW